MLDYALLEALAAVVREGSFERAAQALHLTPSAVSQRVKLLEQRIGQVLVVRGAPCTATEVGLLLLRHTEEVALLERDLHAALPVLAGAGVGTPTLRVAVNADSLATWFVPAMAAFCAGGDALLDLSLDDEAHTADRLRRGDVLAAVTTLAAPGRAAAAWRSAACVTSPVRARTSSRSTSPTGSTPPRSPASRA